MALLFHGRRKVLHDHAIIKTENVDLKRFITIFSIQFDDRQFIKSESLSKVLFIWLELESIIKFIDTWIFEKSVLTADMNSGWLNDPGATNVVASCLR